MNGKGLLVPNMAEVEEIDISNISWVLVVEKEVLKDTTGNGRLTAHHF